MRSSIATYKESLSRIANEVLDAADEIEIPQPRGGGEEEGGSPAPGRRRFSWRLSHVASPIASPVANAIDSESQDEISRYQADIQKLQASEAEIKALSYNYAAILKEKEEELSKLREENGLLRKSLETSATHASQDESLKISTSSSIVLKGTSDQMPLRRQRNISQVNSHSVGNHTTHTNVSKKDGYSNGVMKPMEYDSVQQRMEQEIANSAVKDKDRPDLFEDDNKYLAAIQAKHESYVNQLKAQLDNEHENVTILKQRLKEENHLNEVSQKELHNLKLDNERISTEMKELLKELDGKISEISQLEAKLQKQEPDRESNKNLETLKDMIRTLEKENAKLKIEKDELEENLKICKKSTSEKSSNLHEAEEMAFSIRKLEETLKETSKERDKAKQEVARLKQHLLEKELEDSDKMDEDSKMIEQLRLDCEHQRAQILQLDKALKHEMAKKEEIKKLKNDELQKSSEIINDLRQKLSNYSNTVDSKNVELLNLQTALGQYYAEAEAKDRLGRDLAMAREESAKLSESLKITNQGLEISKREKEELAAKLIQAERILSEGKHSIRKLEEDNSKLRRALEQNMTRLNRMSLDSDNYVDRRIVIKLLVTYFQRNHSKEVLDLMVRMLGFSDEDKQRIGFAQHAASKGVVRGVLGLPGRLVGGILGGTSPDASSHIASDSQSFADLWVDFLLKDAEEREKRESSHAVSASSSAQERSTSTARMPSATGNQTQSSGSSTSLSAVNFSGGQIYGHPPKNDQIYENSDGEFSTVPLTSSILPSESYSSRLPPKY